MTRDSGDDGDKSRNENRPGPEKNSNERDERDERDESSSKTTRTHGDSQQQSRESVAVRGSGPETDESGEPTGRHARLESFQTPGPQNSLWSWPDAKAPHLVVRNYLLILLARISPSLTLKNILLGAIGIEIGDNVSWGLESTPDIFWPERITVGDNAIIGYDTTILCHEFLQDQYRIGDVEIGEQAMIGAGATILPGVTIGERARVASNSLIAEDVPPKTTVAGIPAEVVSTADGVGSANRAGERRDDHTEAETNTPGDAVSDSAATTDTEAEQ